jgi:NarL family two-component system response regulator LiaR
MTAQGRIRVLVVDDHEMVRAGLAIFLEGNDDLELVGETDNGADALTLCRDLEPDVVLIDIVMPVMDGITATRLIHQRQPGIRVIALTSFKDGELARAALRAGAVAYVVKNASVEELARVIKAAVSSVAGSGASMLLDSRAV